MSDEKNLNNETQVRLEKNEYAMFKIRNKTLNKTLTIGLRREQLTPEEKEKEFRYSLKKSNRDSIYSPYMAKEVFFERQKHVIIYTTEMNHRQWNVSDAFAAALTNISSELIENVDDWTGKRSNIQFLMLKHLPASSTQFDINDMLTLTGGIGDFFKGPVREYSMPPYIPDENIQVVTLCNDHPFALIGSEYDNVAQRQTMKKMYARRYMLNVYMVKIDEEETQCDDAYGASCLALDYRWISCKLPEDKMHKRLKSCTAVIRDFADLMKSVLLNDEYEPASKQIKNNNHQWFIDFLESYYGDCVHRETAIRALHNLYTYIAFKDEARKKLEQDKFPMIKIKQGKIEQ